MPRGTSYLVVFVTASSKEEARKIADVVLSKRKAACVNIVSGVASSFWWKGTIDAAEEYLLIIKTKASVLPELIALVKSVHSYEVPEILALPIVGGNDEYLKWLEAEVKG